MKRILFLLLLTVSVYGQNPSRFAKIQITGNTNSGTATKVNVQEADGVVNTIAKNDLIDVVEVNDVPSLPLVGDVGKIYVVKNLNKIYRWNGTFYQELAVTDISGKENSANKQNSLEIDGTNTKYPTVTAVNTGLGLKVDYNLPAIVANSTSGFINKNSQPFIHNFYAGQNPVSGGTGNNLNVGINSGNYNSTNKNYASTMVGFESGMSNKNGYSNVGIGYYALRLNEDGAGNTAVGTYSLGNSKGSQNTAIGWHAQRLTETGDNNTSIGVESLATLSTGSRNVAVGWSSGLSNLSGEDNLFLGYKAGHTELGSNSLYIANKDRTIIGGDFLYGTLFFDSNQNDFLTGQTSKIRISGSGSESKISFLDRSNSFQNAFFDAFDYRFRMSGVDKIVFSYSGVITATSYTGGATLTGTPTAPTAPAGTNTTQVATTAFVQAAAARPYKVYTALLTQVLTNAPVATVLENTTGQTITLARVNVGVYQMILTAPQSKTFVLSTPASNYIFQHISVAGGGTAVNISTASLVGSTITPTDGLLQRTPIEIRIYP